MGRRGPSKKWRLRLAGRSAKPTSPKSSGAIPGTVGSNAVASNSGPSATERRFAGSGAPIESPRPAVECGTRRPTFGSSQSNRQQEKRNDASERGPSGSFESTRSAIVRPGRTAGRRRKRRSGSSTVRPLGFVLFCRAIWTNVFSLDELRSLRVEDVDLAAGRLFVSLQGHRKRLPIAPELRPLIQNAIGERRAGPVFCNRIGRAWTAACACKNFARQRRAAGLPDEIALQGHRGTGGRHRAAS